MEWTNILIKMKASVIFWIYFPFSGCKKQYIKKNLRHSSLNRVVSEFRVEAYHWELF